MESLADLWQEFVADQCRAQGIPDVSGPFRELVRYHFYRRARTWASACLTDVRDIYFNEPYPELHRFFTAVSTMLPLGFEAVYDAEAEAYRFVFRTSEEQE